MAPRLAFDRPLNCRDMMWLGEFWHIQGTMGPRRVPRVTGRSRAVRPPLVLLLQQRPLMSLQRRLCRSRAFDGARRWRNDAVQI